MEVKSNPTVSVCMVTFNHSRYIKTAIESVLAQKSDFFIELIIADDCSTDDTSMIIRGLIEQNSSNYSIRIEYLRNDRNLGMMRTLMNALSNCKGKFIALLDGDDYWMNPNKLQKQVDFLELNPSYVMTTHDVDVVGSVHYSNWFSLGDNNQELTIENWISGYPAQTSSYLFRTVFIKDIPNWFVTLGVGDISLAILSMCKSNLKCYWMKEKMSVYRLHLDGLTSGYYTNSNISAQLKLLEKLIETLEILRAQLPELKNFELSLFKRLAKLYLEKAEFFWYLGDPKSAIKMSFVSIRYSPEIFGRRWLTCFFSSLKLQMKILLLGNEKNKFCICI
jgi:glycosyltransferase involved in cell wall biosynthesis